MQISAFQNQHQVELPRQYLFRAIVWEQHIESTTITQRLQAVFIACLRRIIGVLCANKVPAKNCVGVRTKYREMRLLEGKNVGG